MSTIFYKKFDIASPRRSRHAAVPPAVKCTFSLEHIKHLHDGWKLHYRLHVKHRKYRPSLLPVRFIRIPQQFPLFTPIIFSTETYFISFVRPSLPRYWAGATETKNKPERLMHRVSEFSGHIKEREREIRVRDRENGTQALSPPWC